MKVKVGDLRKYGVNRSHVMVPFWFEDPIGLHLVTVHRNVRIGRHTYMNEGIIRPNVIIGRYCSIGRRVHISAGDHPPEFLSTHPIAIQSTGVPPARLTADRNPKNEKTVVGDDVWIGDNAIIMSGIQIGTGSVIGSNAVVTRDVPPYQIVGGIPARIIRPRFDQETIDRLQASEWWMLPKEALDEMPLKDVDQSLEMIEAMKQKHGRSERSLIECVNE